LSNNDSSTQTADRYWPLRVSIAILALLAAVMVMIMAWGLGRYQPKPESFHHGKIKSPVLALELASNRDDLIEVLQTTNPGLTLSWPNGCGFEIQRGPVCAVRINTIQDCFFIPLYAGFLLCMVLLFSRTPRRGWLGMAGAALAVTVAVFDYAENRGIFRALGTDSLTDQTALAISYPSRAKWTLLGATLLFIGLLICISRLPNFRVWLRWPLSVSYWIVGLMLLAATARLPLFGLATPWFGLLIFISAGGLLGPFFKSPEKPVGP
jgi:hypothetical protein